MFTLADAITRTGTDVPTTRPAGIHPHRHPCCHAGRRIHPSASPPRPRPPHPASTCLSRGENGGNTHALHADGECYLRRDRGWFHLGVLTVTEGSSTALPPEHGYLSITPGTYRIGRQREFAGEWRMVAD